MAVMSKIATAMMATAAVVLPGVAASKHTKSTFAVLHFDGDGPLLEGRMDPVVDPGVISSHVHTVQGGNAFALNMANNFASEANCTTSRVKKDLSNYWVPKLYFQSPDNGTFYDVPLYYMNVYYFFDNTDDDLVPFPPGFRMVSGDPMIRNPPATAGLQLDASKGPIQPVDWVCPQNTDKPAWPADSKGTPIGMSSNGGQEGVGFPNKNCDGTYSPLRADIHFPSCYNPNAGLDNYKNNTAWPSVNNKTQNWNCPEGYVHVPHLFFEAYWNTPKFAGQWKTGGDSQPFVLSNGDPTGYSLHGDFISGWDTDALQYVIDNCNAGDKGMDTCTGIPGGTVTGSDKAPTCNMQTPFQETITGALQQLPGCNPVQKGPQRATMDKSCNVLPKIIESAKGVVSGTGAGLTSGSSSGSSGSDSGSDSGSSSSVAAVSSVPSSGSAATSAAAAAASSPVASSSSDQSKAQNGGSSNDGSSGNGSPSYGNSQPEVSVEVVSHVVVETTFVTIQARATEAPHRRDQHLRLHRKHSH